MVKFYLLYKKAFLYMKRGPPKVMLVTAAPIRTILSAAVATRFLAHELRVDSGNGHSGTEAINLTPETPTAVRCRLIPSLALPINVNWTTHPLQGSF